MPELDWDVVDFIECLEVLPTPEESDQVHFEVDRDGITLKICVRPYDGIIDVALHRCGSENPLIGFRLFVHGQVEFRKEKSREYLWIHKADLLPGRFPCPEYYEHYVQKASIRTHTLVLRVNPDIRIFRGCTIFGG